MAKDNQQNAELVLTLYEPRSLHDRIDYSGNTRKFDKNRLEWALVNGRFVLLITRLLLESWFGEDF